jgi:putative ABC transport system permease protein
MIASDLRWAWRGIRARGWGVAVHIALVAIAVSASAVIFSAADAFVFRPGPYPNANRLVVFQRTSPVGLVETLSANERRLLDARTDLLSATFARTSQNNPFYLDFGGITESVRVEEIAPGLFEAMGVRPRWGRPFVPDDATPGSPPVALVGDAIARRLYGSAAAGVGQIIESQGERRTVVGVMPAGFRFPTALEQVWRPLIRTGRPEAFTTVVGVLASNTSIAAVQQVLDAGATPDPPGRPSAMGPPRVVSLARAQKDSSASTNTGAFTAQNSSLLFTMLLGTALCLALVTCLNVASLAAASAIRRAHSQVVQTSLGATRASLIRTALAEGAILTIAGAGAGVALAKAGTSALAAALPVALDSILTNTIDLDRRGLMFIGVMTLSAWMVSSLPLAWRAGRTNMADALRRNGPTRTVSRGQASLRHLLMTAQVTLSVVLLIGAVLFARSYAARLGQDHGFDDRYLASLDVSLPQPSAVNPMDLKRELLERLAALPSVARLARGPLLPPSPRASSTSSLRTNGEAAPVASVKTFFYTVDPEFFDTAGIRLARGRSFEAGDSERQVVIDEAFAHRFWPSGSALGASFNLGGESTPSRDSYEVIGVAANVRAVSAADPTGTFGIYRRFPADSGSLTFLVRLKSSDGLADVASLARSLAKGGVVRARFVADRYLDLYGDARIAAGVMTGFAGAAFVIALAGLYAVTAFLVAARTREIGIRVALGANRGNIQWLVLRPVVWFVALGTSTGVALALAASRWVGSQIFGVASTDPVTYAAVAGTMIATALLAASRPARTAIRVDPAITLRAD